MAQAWVVSPRALKHHRAMRTTIKLQVIARQQDSKLEESVGYVMIDIRSARSLQAVRPILRCLYFCLCVSVSLSVCLSLTNSSKGNGVPCQTRSIADTNPSSWFKHCLRTAKKVRSLPVRSQSHTHTVSVPMYTDLPRIETRCIQRQHRDCLLIGALDGLARAYVMHACI